MICREILGDVSSEADDAIDWIDIAWPQTLRRALRLVSRGGAQVNVLLPPGARLRHGAVLARTPKTVAIQLEGISVLSIGSEDSQKLLRIAFDLGNLHLPAQVMPAAIYTPDDGPARAIAAEHGLMCTTITARFFPEPISLEPNTFR